MASFLRGLKHLLAHHGHHQKAQDKAPNPALSGDFEAANFVKERLHDASPQTPLQIGNIGPTIASHTGFGCVAVFSMATSERK